MPGLHTLSFGGRSLQINEDDIRLLPRDTTDGEPLIQVQHSTGCLVLPVGLIQRLATVSVAGRSNVGDTLSMHGWQLTILNFSGANLFGMSRAPIFSTGHIIFELGWIVISGRLYITAYTINAQQSRDSELVDITPYLIDFLLFLRLGGEITTQSAVGGVTVSSWVGGGIQAGPDSLLLQALDLQTRTGTSGMLLRGRDLPSSDRARIPPVRVVRRNHQAHLAHTPREGNPSPPQLAHGAQTPMGATIAYAANMLRRE